ncbi:MAG: hypothetical protein ACRDJM_00210 [Actinomycetota bacterium]
MKLSLIAMLISLGSCGEGRSDSRIRIRDVPTTQTTPSPVVSYHRLVRTVSLLPERKLLVAPGSAGFVSGQDAFQNCLAKSSCRALATSASRVEVVLGIYQNLGSYVGDDAVGGKHPLTGRAVWVVVFRDTLIPAFGPGQDTRGTAFTLVDATTGAPREGFFTGLAPAAADLESL